MAIIGNYPFLVEPFTEDAMGNLSWGLLGNQLLRCAGMQAGSCGFGFEDMEQYHHVWVLARLIIDMEEMPRTGQAYNIQTWVTKVYHQFTDRLFTISSPEGHTFGHAFSTWALINYETREPMDLAHLPEGNIMDFTSPKTIPLKKAGRCRVTADCPIKSNPVYYSDLDINGHVNSIRYIQMAADLFTQEICSEGHSLYRVEVGFANETYLGDTLHFYTDGFHNNQAQVDIRRNDGKTAAKVALFFR